MEILTSIIKLYRKRKNIKGETLTPTHKHRGMRAYTYIEVAAAFYRVIFTNIQLTTPIKAYTAGHIHSCLATRNHTSKR